MSMNDPNRRLDESFGPNDSTSTLTKILGIAVLIIVVGGLIWAGKFNHTKVASPTPAISQTATTTGSATGGNASAPHK